MDCTGLCRPASKGTLDTRTESTLAPNHAVFVVLLNESYIFFAKFANVVFGSQQSESTVLPAGDVNPTAHAVHTETPLAEYVFAAHTSHAAVPDAFLNLPASHAGHGPPFGPVYPTLQEQDVTIMLPADEFEFAGHNVHAALPFVGLYVPTAHMLHCPL